MKPLDNSNLRGGHANIKIHGDEDGRSVTISVKFPETHVFHPDPSISRAIGRILCLQSLRHIIKGELRKVPKSIRDKLSHAVMDYREE